MKNTSISERISQVIDYVGISKNAFAQNIGYERSQVIYDILNDKAKPSFDFFNKFINSEYSELVNIKWLISGKGEMLKTQTFNDGASSNDNETHKPFIDSIYAVCGAPTGFNATIMKNECENISIPFLNDYDFSIRASGDSMINRANPKRSIRDRDIVACKYWTSRNYLRWGEVYALSTAEGIIIKVLQKSKKEGHVRCVSFNEQDGFEPFDIEYEQVHDWAIVVGSVSINTW